MYFQQTSAGTVSDRFQQTGSYEEVLKNRVLYRVCIARTQQISEIAPSKRNETVVSATSLKVRGHQAGVGIEFKVCINLVVMACVLLAFYQMTLGLHRSFRAFHFP
jgi:hypothetical protein